jgi:putative SOS response-associated peptidase YedK
LPPWIGTRGIEAEPAEGEPRLFGFLTCEANAIVRPVHAKAMPVILTTPEACDACLTGSVEDVIAMLCPLPPEGLRIVATAVRKDEPALMMAD